MKVLLVEDDFDLRLTLATCLSDLGFDVSVADNGEDALEILRIEAEEPFTLICTDFNMPKLNGVSMLIEADRLGLATPEVICFSGKGIYDPIITDLKSRNISPNIHFLEKPFSLEMFEASIVNVRLQLMTNNLKQNE